MRSIGRHAHLQRRPEAEMIVLTITITTITTATTIVVITAVITAVITIIIIAIIAHTSMHRLRLRAKHWSGGEMERGTESGGRGRERMTVAANGRRTGAGEGTGLLVWR